MDATKLVYEVMKDDYEVFHGAVKTMTMTYTRGPVEWTLDAEDQAKQLWSYAVDTFLRTGHDSAYCLLDSLLDEVDFDELRDLILEK